MGVKEPKRKVEALNRLVCCPPFASQAITLSMLRVILKGEPVKTRKGWPTPFSPGERQLQKVYQQYACCHVTFANKKPNSSVVIKQQPHNYLHHETGPFRVLLTRWHNNKQLLTVGKAEPASSPRSGKAPPWRRQKYINRVPGFLSDLRQKEKMAWP